MISARVGLVWSLVERYVILLIGIAASVVLARLLTPAQVGVFSLCAATVAIASTVRDFGVGDYIIQERRLDREKMRAAFAVAVTTAWSIGLLLFLSRELLARSFGSPEISSLIAILSMGFFIAPLASPAYAMLNREMAFRQIFFIQLACAVAQALTSVLLALRGFGAQSLAWGVVAGVAVQALIVTALSPKTSLLWPKLSGARAVFRFGAYQMSSRILDTATSGAHEFVIARQFGFTSVGLFSRAKTFVDMFHNNVTAALTRVATPALANAHRADESLVERFARGTALITSVSWPFFGFLALATPELIRVLYGAQWDQSAATASWLAIGMLPTALSTLSSAVMTAMGAVERRLNISLIWCPVHLVGLGIGSMYSLEAMAMAWVCTNCVIAILYTRQMRALLNATLRQLYGPSAKSLVVVAATAGVQTAALAWMRAEAMPKVVILFVAAAVGFGVWLVCVRSLRHPVYEELIRVAHRLGVPWPAARAAGA